MENNAFHNQNVHVQSPRAPAFSANPPASLFDSQAKIEQRVRRETGVHHRDRVQVVGLRHRADGFGFVHSRDVSEPDRRIGSERVNGVTQIFQPLPQVGTQPEVSSPPLRLA